MKYSLMVTSLYESGARKNVEYYSIKEQNRNMYCDAILSAEAASKYILANHYIDEIITIGSNLTYDPGDEQVNIVLREGSSFYSSDINELSTYSLLRYRLAQYIDELRIEEQDIRELLDDDEQDRVIGFLKDFYHRNLQSITGSKFNRFFDYLVNDIDLRNKVLEELGNSIPEAAQDTDRYHTWIRNYLYSELRDSSKMELMRGNENVQIAFIPTDEGGTMSFVDKLLTTLKGLAGRTEEHDEFDLYICIQSDNVKDTLTLMNFLDIVKSMPGDKVNIKKVVTGTHTSEALYNDLSDDTELYGTSSLLAGTRSFLQYGKTDMLMHAWHKQKTENKYIERMLYAMRNIDIGISLCDIGDIERGINSLKRLFAEEKYVPGDSIFEKYFEVIVRGIKEDYGVLVSKEHTEFIDLVKWAYKKDFWQQTLTLIESKAPADFVERGIFYYCNDKESKERATKLFGDIYYDFKPFEKYKLDNVSHYFVKFYGRGRVGRTINQQQFQERYTEGRIADLDTNDPNTIKAFTICPDRELLSNLLFAYYKLGDVRNATDHAEEGSKRFRMLEDESDVGERMSMIEQAVESFIYMYDQVIAAIGDAKADVWTVSNEEIRAYAATLKPKFGKGGGNKHDKPKDAQNDKQEKEEN